MGDYLAGRVDGCVIDDYIAAWHDSDSDLALHEFLGMTTEQYRQWFDQHHLPERGAA